MRSTKGVGALVWSPLGWGRLTGKIRRGQPLPETSRLHSKLVVDAGPTPDWEYVHKVVDAIDEVAKETGKSILQISPSTGRCAAPPSLRSSSARATRSNSAPTSPASSWQLTPEQLKRLDEASATKLAYPYWHQIQFSERNPFPVAQTLITEA